MSTYTPIASQTLSTSAPSVTFSSIPQGYTDLVLTSSGIGTGATNHDLILQFNGDTATNYSSTRLYGDGTSALSDRLTTEIAGVWNGYWGGSGTTTQNFTITQIMNYSNTTTYKTSLTRQGPNNAGQVWATAALWRNTNAINSLKLYLGTGNIASGATFTLYGIQVGDKAQKAQGGNTVTSDGTYVYHTFTSSGSFIPSEALTVDYLVVAGGGSGGSGGVGGGGGGGGGMRCTVTGTGGSGSPESALSLSAGKSYSVIVGAGGAGVETAMGNNGNNSVFATITSTGGGGGSNGGATGVAGSAGGSGGGGAGRTGTATGGAASPSGQGFAGGAGVGTGGSDGGGGGGGASQQGQQGQNPIGGYGGAGRATDISGSSVTYAGGGGGGSGSGSTGGVGGAGGGGNGGAQTGAGYEAEGTPGTANTGGGSGGTRNGSLLSKNGGSGIVIIRYAV